MRKFTRRRFGVFQISASLALASCLHVCASGQSQSPDSNSEYTVAGRALQSDGQAASNALIRFRDGMGDWDQAVANEGGEFQFSLACRPHAIVYFYAADRSEVFWVEFRNNNIAERVKTPIEINLVPAESIPVLVQQGGLPILGASVVGRTKEFGWNFAPEKTDELGKAAIVIPVAHQLDQVWAIEPETGLGGRSRFVNNPNEVLAIELMPSQKKSALVLDENEKPVANIRVKAGLQCEDKSKITGELPELYSVTDKHGYASFDWFPRDKQWGFRAGVYENAKFSWDYSKKSSRNQAFLSGPYRDLRLVYVTSIPPTILINGRIQGEIGDVSGIRVGGYGMGPNGQSDLPFSISDESGKFSLQLMPGLTYIVGITDDKLACDLVEVKVDLDGKPVEPIELQSYPAVPLTIKVTQGQDKRPLSDVSVQHFQRKRILIAPGHSGEPVLAQGKILDKRGIVVFGSPSGNIRVNLGFQKWSAYRDIEVVQGEPAMIEFHAPAFGVRKVTGSIVPPKTETWLKLSDQNVVLDSKEHELESRSVIERSNAEEKKAFLADQIRKHIEKNAGNCTISVFSPFGNPRVTVTQSNERGRWSVDLDANLICVHAVSAGRKFSAFKTYREFGGEIGNLELKPCVTVSGRLLSPAKTPLANQEIFLTREVPYDILSVPVHYLSTKTDDEGRFKFLSVGTDLEQRISIRTGTGNIQYLTHASTYEPGEDIVGLDVIYQERVAPPLRLPNK